MKKRGKDLTFKERKIIKELLAQGAPTRYIATSLSRCFSTISMEIKRGGGRKKYSPRKSQNNARKRVLPIGRTVTDNDRILIQKWLEEGKSKLDICAKLNLGRNQLYRELKDGGWPEKYCAIRSKIEDRVRTFGRLRRFWKKALRGMFRVKVG
jgi:IS30 family transposase